MCPICLYEDESLQHHFSQCPLTSAAWERHFGRGIISDDPQLSFCNWLTFHVLDFRDEEGLGSPNLVKFIGILWAIWITCNHQVFRQIRATLEGLQLHVNMAYDQHQVFSAQNYVVQTTGRAMSTAPPGFLMTDLGLLSSGHPQTTFCIDGSWDASSHSGTSAWVASRVASQVQNMQGKRVFATSALQTEIYACHLALSWAAAQGLTHILLLTDSALLIHLLQSEVTKDISILHPVWEIREMGSTLRWCRLMKVGRSEVTPAHDLAQFSRTSSYPVALL